MSSNMVYSKCKWLIGMIEMSSNKNKGMNRQMKNIMFQLVTMDKKLQNWRNLGVGEYTLKIQLKSILEGTTLMMSFKHGRGHGNPFISRMAKH
jgi:hypothetical protein